MKILTLVLILLNLVACGTKHVTFSAKMESKYKKYATAYFNDADAYGYRLDSSNLIIKTGNIVNESTMGVCSLGKIEEVKDFQTIITNVKTVTIDSAYWDELSEIGRYELIYHELSHCLIGAEHNNKYANVENWHPSLIMNEGNNIFSSNDIKNMKIKYWDALVENLFTGKDVNYSSYYQFKKNRTALISNVWANENKTSLGWEL